jgi:hypothetical protein
MGSPINTTFADSLPFLSSNEHVLYFQSTRPGGCGQGDIWMTRRQNKDSDWEEPSNLGCVLNTPVSETAPAFFEDPETEQAWLFYGSNRTGGIGDFDVYASRQEKMAQWVPESWFPNSAARNAILESSSERTAWKLSSPRIAPVAKGSIFGSQRGRRYPTSGPRL